MIKKLAKHYDVPVSKVFEWQEKVETKDMSYQEILYIIVKDIVAKQHEEKVQHSI